MIMLCIELGERAHARFSLFDERRASLRRVQHPGCVEMRKVRRRGIRHRRRRRLRGLTRWSGRGWCCRRGGGLLLLLLLLPLG